MLLLNRQNTLAQLNPIRRWLTNRVLFYGRKFGKSKDLLCGAVAAMAMLPGSTTQGDEIITWNVYSCSVQSLTNAEFLPSALKLHVDVQSGNAEIHDSDVYGRKIDRPVAIVSKGSETSFALLWQQSVQARQRQVELQYRAILNTTNNKFTITVNIEGETVRSERGIGECEQIATARPVNAQATVGQEFQATPFSSL